MWSHIELSNGEATNKARVKSRFFLKKTMGVLYLYLIFVRKKKVGLLWFLVVCIEKKNWFGLVFFGV